MPKLPTLYCSVVYCCQVKSGQFSGTVDLCLILAWWSLHPGHHWQGPSAVHTVRASVRNNVIWHNMKNSDERYRLNVSVLNIQNDHDSLASQPICDSLV